MKMRKLRSLSALFAGLLLCAALGACAGEDGAGDTDATTAAATTATTVAVTTTEPETTTTAAPEPVKDPAQYNRITGLYDNPAGGSSRAVAVMVGNNKKSRPQIGLCTADAYLEAETEGGITRIMAIFADSSRVPSQLCPIRSARTPFVLMAQALDVIYVHAGGSKPGLQKIKDIGQAEIDALGNHGSTFWRDSNLRSSRGLEYSLCSSGEKLTARIGQLKLRNTSDRAPFTFGTEAAGGDCAKLQVTFSGSQTIAFTYDAESGLYTKRNGTLSSGEVHKTTDGTPLQVTNVIVMYDTKYNENATTINFNLNSGEGLLCSGGKIQSIRWSRSSSGLAFTGADGKAATVLPGKTYICLVSKTNKSKTVTG